MLHLAAHTRASWLPEANAQVDVLLLDHAHCEKKAASTAMNLIFRYGDRPRLVRTLAALAEEELQHFQLMLDLIGKRGGAYAPLTPSDYAGKLLKAARSQEPHRLIDTLLCCALIEARSCERMKILSEGLLDPELRALYASLLASEARHFHTYVDLATDEAPREAVRARLAELAAHEAEVLAVPGRHLRMHS